MIFQSHEALLGPLGLVNRFDSFEKLVNQRFNNIEAALIGDFEKPGVIRKVNNHLEEHRRVAKRNFAIISFLASAVGYVVMELRRWLGF